MNAERTGKKQVLLRPISTILIKFLKIMLKNQYILSFQLVDDHRTGKIIINLCGRINKCGCISPRYSLSYKNLTKYFTKFIPSRTYGYVILTTSKGIVDHRKAMRNRISGKLLGFFY
mmetsp:Transcript_9020/g.14240  ORF Transcript_9020/g.14240 Transcript_9020/m.14240 type:complete len:117 (-) Transcript_9020:137-487(-)